MTIKSIQFYYYLLKPMFLLRTEHLSNFLFLQYCSFVSVRTSFWDSYRRPLGIFRFLSSPLSKLYFSPFHIGVGWHSVIFVCVHGILNTYSSYPSKTLSNVWVWSVVPWCNGYHFRLWLWRSEFDSQWNLLSLRVIYFSKYPTGY